MFLKNLIHKLIERFLSISRESWTLLIICMLFNFLFHFFSSFIFYIGFFAVLIYFIGKFMLFRQDRLLWIFKTNNENNSIDATKIGILEFILLVPVCAFLPKEIQKYGIFLFALLIVFVSILNHKLFKKIKSMDEQSIYASGKHEKRTLFYLYFMEILLITVLSMFFSLTYYVLTYEQGLFYVTIIENLLITSLIFPVYQVFFKARCMLYPDYKKRYNIRSKIVVLLINLVLSSIFG